MKVENLIIERKPSYADEYAGLLVGLVQIQGEHGKMEVKLSNLAVSEIFNLIKDDVQRTANYNASQAELAVTDASAEMKLIQADVPDKDDNEPF